ncbi:MAG: hypothetical protein ACAI44_05280 [Candidatus Sericytochromatia bacterium]
MRKNLSLAFFLSLALLLGCLYGCGPAPTANPPRNLKFSSISVSPQQALPNAPVTVSWSYENETKLQSQWMEIVSLTIQGSMFRCVQGRPFDNNGQVEARFSNNPEMPLEGRGSRSVTFPFTGPVTVLIGATDTQGKVLKAAIDVMMKDSSLQVQVSPAEDLTGNVDIRHPRGLMWQTKPTTLTFPIFFATYDYAPSGVTPDGNIQFFKDLGLVTDGSKPFFGRSTNDRPPLGNEPGYGFTQGYSFPLMDAAYIDSADAHDRSLPGQPPFRYGQRADVMLLAAKLSYTGEALDSIPVGREPASEGGLTGSGLNLQPLVFQIDFRTEDAGALHIVDMHIGNSSEGYIASAFAGLTSNRFLNVSPLPKESYSIGGGDHETGTFSGNLTGGTPLAKLGMNSNDLDSTAAYVNINAVSWQNVPLFTDDNLGGLGNNSVSNLGDQGLLLDERDQQQICRVPQAMPSP